MQITQMGLKDKRMKLVNEVFNGIKVRIVICSDYSVIPHFIFPLNFY